MPFVTEELWQGMPHEGKANQAIHFVIAESLEAYLPLADMVDNGKEVQRLKKHSTKLQADFDSSMKRLSSRNVSEQDHSLCHLLPIHFVRTCPLLMSMLPTKKKLQLYKLQLWNDLLSHTWMNLQFVEMKAPAAVEQAVRVEQYCL